MCDSADYFCHSGNGFSSYDESKTQGGSIAPFQAARNKPTSSGIV
jgi:hypothetical protein